MEPLFRPIRQRSPEQYSFFFQDMRHLTENKAGRIFTELDARHFESVGVRNGTWGENEIFTANLWTKETGAVMSRRQS
jgi:hypothetical protein